MDSSIPLILRPAHRADSEILLSWRNDPETIRNSLQSNSVTFEEHEIWLESSLSRADREIFIAEKMGQAIGVVRFDWDEKKGAWELSWTIAPEFRGKGLGKEMVRSAALKHPSVFARVKAANLASIAIAQAAGLSIWYSEGEIQFFRKTG